MLLIEINIFISNFIFLSKLLLILIKLLYYIFHNIHGIPYIIIYYLYNYIIYIIIYYNLILVSILLVIV